MIKYEIDVCVIGGGAAGMSAALKSSQTGAKTLLIERASELGGVLLQCIHNGFGLHHFKEELTGPAYAERVEEELRKTTTEIWLDSVVVKLTSDHEVHIISPEKGYQIVQAKAIVFAVGCRERTRYQIDLPGPRLAGIMNAGHAQHYVNMDGYMVGKRVLILGSGDIGLIMARRLTLEGATVVGVAELMPYSNGLNRNIVQCLDDFQIPLYLSHTVVNVMGHKRLEKVVLAQVDDHLQPILGTEKEFEVDTLLLSVGLIPENKLLQEIGVNLHPKTNGAFVDNHLMTNIPGVFACGNALHVHDLVDFVSEEGEWAGASAALYAQGLLQSSSQLIDVRAQSPVRYVLPAQLNPHIQTPITLKLRVAVPMKDVYLQVMQGDRVLKKVKKIHLIPSEMERIEINPSMLHSQEPLVVMVLEGGAQ